MLASIRLIAIGGGGFTHQTDPAMEDFILAQSGRARPRIGFLGTASDDDPLKIRRFHERFNALPDAPSHRTRDGSAEEIARWTEQLDVLYVGGGNTLRLIAHWRQSGWDAVLVAAARRGVLMAGVSAGASAWFAQALSDAGGSGLRPVHGIGMVAGSCCPHYAAEPHRQPAFAAAVASGELAAGLAIDDGAAVLIDNDQVSAVFSARPGAGAYRVSRVGELSHTTTLAISHQA